MSGTGWVLKGVDEAQRQHIRAQAARAGMSVAEYLSHVLQNALPDGEGEPAPRLSEAEKPSTRHRLDGLERKVDLAVGGLEDHLRSFDQSLYALAERFDETETLSQDTAQAVSHALAQFGTGLEELKSRADVSESALVDLRGAQERFETETVEARSSLTDQIARAHEIALSAESTAALLAEKQEALNARLNHDIAALSDSTQETIQSGLASARAAAEAAAQSAEDALNEALEQMRLQRDALEERVEAGEAQAAAQFEAVESKLSSRIDGAEALIDSTARGLQEKLAHLAQSAHAAARDASEQAKRGIASLSADIKSHEARLGEAIAELRVAQSADVEKIGEIEAALAPIGERISHLEDEATQRAEDGATLERALGRLEQELRALAERPVSNLDESILARFDGLSARLRLQETQTANAGAKAEDIEKSLERLATHVSDVTHQAQSSFQSLEASVSDLMRRSSAAAVLADVESVSERLSQRVDAIEHATTELLADQRAAFAQWIEDAQAAFASHSVSGAVSSLDQRLDALDQAQTLMSKTLSDTVAALEGRLAGMESASTKASVQLSGDIAKLAKSLETRVAHVEAQTDASPGGVSREELARLVSIFDSRFADFERRDEEINARMGEDMSNMRAKLDERFAHIERRTVLAVEKIAESVAILGKRLNQRQEEFVLDLVERVEAADPRLALKLTKKA